MWHLCWWVLKTLPGVGVMPGCTIIGGIHGTMIACRPEKASKTRRRKVQRPFHALFAPMDKLKAFSNRSCPWRYAAAHRCGQGRGRGTGHHGPAARMRWKSTWA